MDLVVEWQDVCLLINEIADSEMFWEIEKHVGTRPCFGENSMEKCAQFFVDVQSIVPQEFVAHRVDKGIAPLL